MKNLIVLVVVVFAMMFANLATAQEITPRGFEDEPAATATAPVETTTTDTAEESTEEATPAETGPDFASLENRLTALETAAGRFVLSNEHLLLVDEVARLKASNKAQEKAITELYSNDLWNRRGVIILIIVDLIFIAFILILAFARRKKNNEEGNDDHGNYEEVPRTGRTVTTLLVGLLTLAFATQSADASCVITSIGNGAVIVKEQASAPISIGVTGCTDVKSIQLAAVGVTVTDVAQQGNVVTGKVTANANAQEGPAIFKIGMADGSKAVSPNSIFFLVLNPAQAGINKTANSAHATANATAKKVTALEAKIKSVPTKAQVEAIVDNKVKAFPSRADVQSAINPVDAKVRELEKTIQFQAEQIEILRQAGELTVVAVEKLAETKVKKGFWGKKPLNSSVAKAASEIRTSLALPVEEGQQ